MKKLENASEIWGPYKIEKPDIEGAIEYATISLPWTFDRMRYGPKKQHTVNDRLIHILLGVLNQTILERVLTEKGYKCSKQWKRYRDSDIFDFHVNGRKYDVKTTHIYSEYSSKVNREDFSPELLMANKDYAGPEWRHFFPVMVPISQLTVDKIKDAYIFGISETYQDIRHIEPKKLDKGFWCAAPFGKAFFFMQSTYVIRRREEEGKGFRVRISWKRNQRSLIGQRKTATLTIFGEWAGERQTEKIDLRESKTLISEKTFSSLSCLRFTHPAIMDDFDQIIVTVENDFREIITKPNNPRINLNDANFEWILGKDSFVNLRMPDDYCIWWIGFIPFTIFATTFPSYPSYFIPHPKDMSINVPGQAITKVKEKLEYLSRRREKAISEGKNIPWPDFVSLIGKKGRINAGLLVAAQRFGRPIGAACYFYPPFGFQETAIYVLPKDLYCLDFLPK
ncbi:hypothetical protein G4O51_03190 [Candidatus Bathyarchaeota archaeon A05DMB-2]|nr:hypothetical protein [Candidatus Bathyarchaeota archaeon A05DMB-2]